MAMAYASLKRPRAETGGISSDPGQQLALIEPILDSYRAGSGSAGSGHARGATVGAGRGTQAQLVGDFTLEPTVRWVVPRLQRPAGVANRRPATTSTASIALGRCPVGSEHRELPAGRMPDENLRLLEAGEAAAVNDRSGHHGGLRRAFLGGGQGLRGWDSSG